MPEKEDKEDLQIRREAERILTSSKARANMYQENLLGLAPTSKADWKSPAIWGFLLGARWDPHATSTTLVQS